MERMVHSLSENQFTVDSKLDFKSTNPKITENKPLI